MPATADRGLVAAELRNASGLAIELLPNGSILAIRHGDVLVNQVLGSPLEGGIGNIYVRRHGDAGIASVPAIGPGSESAFHASADHASWAGFDGQLEYDCTLRLAPTEPTWYWTMRLLNRSDTPVVVDAVLAQDLGLAHEATVRSSELYTSQYIDHTILEDERLGYLVCSRQNLPQGDAHPWVMHGCLDGTAGFLTDGFQFYGLGYRDSNRPEALSRPTLPNRTYQYEFALPTLQSRSRSLEPGATAEITFFASFEADHPAATSADDTERARTAAAMFAGLPAVPAAPIGTRPPDGLFGAPTLFPSRDLEPEELERYFGSAWRHVERREGTLLSFFHGRQQHVVLRAKELVAERPTGHVMRSGRDLLPTDDLLSNTAWMSGVFGSQVTIGNTSYNKLVGVCRNPLNVLKSSGQRIFVRSDRGDELLGVPSAFEMGPNDARWVYADDERTIVVRVATSLDAPVTTLEIAIERGGPLELLISHDVVAGENEHGPPAKVAVDATRGRVEIRPATDTLLAQRYPEATFFLVTPDPDRIAALGGDALLSVDGVGRGTSHVVVRSKPVTSFSLAMTGSILDAGRAAELADAHGRQGGRAGSTAEDAGSPAAAFWSALGRGATLGGASGRTAEDLGRLDETIGWYLHDALIHCTVPHGLEQYSGAAWGLRDVCQGPAELFVATDHPAELGEVIRIVYRHQLRETGDWPQWFMFDRYREIQSPDSHADIIHWPIKALCDYVEATGDLSILDEEVAWTDDRTRTVTSDTATILAHTERQIERIERDCIPGTALPVFAGGDWEDTLQPADPAMAQRLVSSWTVELAYQTLERYRTVCERAGRTVIAERLATLCSRIREDFNRHLMPDGVVAGLAHFGEDGIEYFLHPRDRRTGVAYRLLPMTRGMISGLFTPEQATRHADLIERHLSFPDGVRLMDRPMEYRGGTSRYFKRAESAANFGREVGLQYVHGHIRYIEAMARIGRPDEAFRGLMAICPVGLEHALPSALPRQANAYFSSSDAAFLDRDEASREFDRIRTGDVGVKGGWRVYSSGPGIYLNQLISNVLGLRRHYDDVVFDPVLPRDADGLVFDLEWDGRPVRYRYEVSGDGFAPSAVTVNGRPMPVDRRTANPYRPGGVLVSRQVFGEALRPADNVVDILV